MQVKRGNVPTQRDVNERLGRAARAARERAFGEGISQEEVAEALSVSRTTIYRFERGDTMPRDPRLFVHRYAALVGADEDDLWRAALNLADADPLEVETSVPGPSWRMLKILSVLLAILAVLVAYAQEGGIAPILRTWAQFAGGIAFLVAAVSFFMPERMPLVAKVSVVGFCVFEAGLRIKTGFDLLAGEAVGVPVDFVVLHIGQVVGLWGFLAFLTRHQQQRISIKVRDVPRSTSNASS